MLQNKIVARSYNKFEITPNKQIIYKISETERLANEIEYYRQNKVKNCFPKFYSKLSGKIGNEYVLALEYLQDYISLGQLLVEQELDPFLINWICGFIVSRLKTLHKSNKVPTNYPCELYTQKIYLEKTLEEYEKLKNTRPDLFQEGFFKVQLNDEKPTKCALITEDHIRELFEKLEDFPFSVIHGDFCLANILINPSTLDIKFVDPRGSFGAVNCFGDPRYDLAKLKHSFDGGYEYLIHKKYTTVYHSMFKGFFFQNLIERYYTITFENSNYKLFKGNLEEMLPELTREDIKIIEGFIFLGMIARHDDDPKRQEAMFYIGQKILNECM